LNLFDRIILGFYFYLRPTTSNEAAESRGAINPKYPDDNYVLIALKKASKHTTMHPHKSAKEVANNQSKQMKLFYRLPASFNSDRLKADHQEGQEEMSQANEYDTDDSSDLLPRPQRMSAPKQDRAKNPTECDISSSNDQSVSFSSTTRSPVEKKKQALLLRALGDDESSTASEQELLPTPPPTRKYIEVPARFLPQNDDDCDEAEKLARKRRCDEIMSLSAKIVAEAKAAANRRHLKWAEPTFNPFPSSNTSNLPVSQHASGKRNGPQEDEQGQGHTYLGRQTEGQEVQYVVNSTNQWVPLSGKRRRSESESD
jgi:hypothetical protein